MGRSKKYLEKINPVIRQFTGAFWEFLKKPEYLVVLFGIVFGIQILIYTPPFQVCDEPQHLFSAYRISEGHILPQYRKGTSVSGSYVPRSFQLTVNTTGANKMWSSRKNRQDVEAVHEAFKIPLNPSDKKFKASYFQYPALCYAPQALGMFVGRLFGASPITLMYLARLFNLLVLIILAFFTIRLTPILKWTFFLLFLMPMTLFQLSSSSADGPTFALAFFITAYFFWLAFDPSRETVQKKDYYSLAAIGFLLGMLKPPYFLLVFMFFLVPWKRFGSWKKYLIAFGLLLLGVIVIAGGWQLVAGRHTAIMLSKNIRPMDQFVWIAHHPRAFASLMRSTFRHNQYYIQGLIAGIGWVNVKPPEWLVYGYLFALLAVSALDKNDIEVGRFQRVFAFLLSLGTVVAVTAALFATANNVGVPLDKHVWTDKSVVLYIWGITGRYFVPPMALFFLVLYNKTIIYKKSKWFYLAVSLIGLIGGVATVNLLAERFY